MLVLAILAALVAFVLLFLALVCLAVADSLSDKPKRR